MAYVIGVKRPHITATLDHAFYNQSLAAKLLNINLRQFVRKINLYNILSSAGAADGHARRNLPPGIAAIELACSACRGEISLFFSGQRSGFMRGKCCAMAQLKMRRSSSILSE